MRDRKAIFYQVVVPGLVAILLGVLEAAWTRPGGGGPANTWMGIFAILGVLLLVSFPRLWRIALLAIIEEASHLILTSPLSLELIYRQVFFHWSISYVGGNIYPWIFFPVLTIVGELLYRYFKARR